jgi:EF hand
MEYLMTKTIISCSFFAFAILSTPAFAVEADAAIDTDGDGAYNLAEMQAAFPEVTEVVFVAIDANENGTVDVDEFAVAKGAGLIGS